MFLKHKFISVTLALALFALSASPSFGKDDHGHGHSWGYEGGAGSSHWGDLKPEFAACKLGKNQSPIDIQSATPNKLDPIKFNYKNSPLKIIDNGHTIQANYASGSSISIKGKEYHLIQVHFHQPSEEKINGKAYPMDAHLVHKGEDGKLAVVAVLMKEGQHNDFLQTLWENIPQQKEKEIAVENVNINLEKFLPEKKSYYAFTGSLTTPPCSEGVNWMVLNTPVEMSSEQIGSFGKYYNHNARPVQPLNDRTILVSE
jgi:carbonic anhydrase